MDSSLSCLKKLLPDSIHSKITEQTEEIRFRVNQRVMLLEQQKEILTSVRCDKALLEEVLECLTKSSLYTYFDSISQGYLTIEGGHRVGICGTGVYQNGTLAHITDVSSLNIRIAHEIKGCSEKLFHQLVSGDSVPGVLLISPPGCGKTTLLRDFIRLLSHRIAGIRIAVVDERSEIVGVHLGEAQNDLGMRCDILNGYAKSDGICHAVRALSPNVIAVDEIGSKKDEDSLLYAHYAGVTILATVHGNKSGDFKHTIRRLHQEKAFDYYVYLSKNNPHSRIEKIEAVKELSYV